MENSTHTRHLWGKYVDFLLLGGSSFIILPVLYFVGEFEDIRSSLIGLSFFAAGFINQPHFAHSYIILYRQLIQTTKQKTWNLSISHIRLLWAGIFFPAFFLLFFLYAITSQDLEMLGIAANLMFLTVGWHYTKQGYGMLMLDCSLKKFFFSSNEKKILLFNGYVIWIISWIQLNNVLRNGSYFGVDYFLFTIPNGIFNILASAALISTTLTLLTVARRLSQTNGQSMPLAGLAGYSVSLYPWLIIFDPFLAYFIPALHSIQYLTVTSKFEINRERDQKRGSRKSLNITLTLVIAIALGYFGFQILPNIIDNQLGQLEKNISIGAFACWIFINVHHFFIDNVIWKKENFEASLYLFKN